MRLLRTGWALGVVAGALIGTRAHAQTPADLAAGRQLFVEALRDEEQGRFAEALGKYRDVLRVRDTANIRFRMGSSLEHLGKLAQAAAAYAAAIRLGSDQGGKGGDDNVVTGAQARLDAIAPKVAHLSLLVPPGLPNDTDVTVDAEPIRSEALGDVTVDPGPHVVSASATGLAPFRAEINVPEGARLDVLIAMKSVPASGAAPPSAAPGARESPYRTVGILSGAAGGALLIGGVVALALRSSAITALKDACPSGICPIDRQEELTGIRDRANVEGPLGAVFLATGIAALGAGISLLALGGGEPKRAVRLVPAPVSRGAVVTFATGF